MALSALALLTLAAAVDGEAALRHSRALAALGPHPWGSPRASFAAQYLAAEFRSAGLLEVRSEEFEHGGRTGRNVLGVLRAPGSAFVLLAAHHDSPPGGTGEGGGAAGVLIEVARALASDPARPPRTVVFAALDGGSPGAPFSGVGAREWLRRQGADVRHLSGALVLGSAGRPAGTPTLHPLAVADPLRPGHTIVAPGWLLAAALRGSAAAGAPFAVHDSWLSAVQQPLARLFRIDRRGSEQPLVEADLPALLVSDGPPSFSWRAPGAVFAAVAEDPATLARTGQAMLGAARALAAEMPGGPRDPHWFAAFGQVFGRAAVAALGVAALLPFAWRGRRAGGVVFAVRGLVVAGAAYLLWRHPVPTTYAIAPWLLALTAGPRPWAALAGALPALAAAALATAAWLHGSILGSWVRPLDAAIALGVALIALVPLPGRRGPRPARSARRAGLPGQARKRR